MSVPDLVYLVHSALRISQEYVVTYVVKQLFVRCKEIKQKW